MPRKKPSDKMHHEARRYCEYNGEVWGVSDCFHTTPRVQMTTDWDKVTCGNCLKSRAKEVK